MKIRVVSIALEIVAGGGMAEFRPAFGAPVFDEACLADEPLEAFRLADGRVRRMPQPDRLSDIKVATFEEGS